MDIKEVHDLAGSYFNPVVRSTQGEIQKFKTCLKVASYLLGVTLIGAALTWLVTLHRDVSADPKITPEITKTGSLGQEILQSNGSSAPEQIVDDINSGKSTLSAFLNLDTSTAPVSQVLQLLKEHTENIKCADLAGFIVRAGFTADLSQIDRSCPNIEVLILPKTFVLTDLRQLVSGFHRHKHFEHLKTLDLSHLTEIQKSDLATLQLPNELQLILPEGFDDPR